MDMLSTAQLALAALAASTAFANAGSPSQPGPMGTGEGHFAAQDRFDRSEGPRMGREGRRGSEQARTGMQHPGRGMGDSPRMRRGGGHGEGGLKLQLVSLQVVEAQEWLGDEAQLELGAHELSMGGELYRGTVRPLSYVKPVPLDGSVTLSLWERDPELLGRSTHDHMGTETLAGLDPGSYTTTFAGHGGRYTLSFEVLPARSERPRLAQGGERDRSRGHASRGARTTRDSLTRSAGRASEPAPWAIDPY